MKTGKITLFGLASVLMNDLKKPKSLQELRRKYPNTEGFLLLERSIALLINLSLIEKNSDGTIRAKRARIETQDLLYAALG